MDDGIFGALAALFTVKVIFVSTVLKFSASVGVNTTSYSVLSLSATVGFVAASFHVNVPVTASSSDSL